MNEQPKRDKRPEITDTVRPPAPRSRRIAVLAAGALMLMVLFVVAARRFAPNQTASQVAQSGTAAEGEAVAADEEAAPVPVQVTRAVLRPMETVVSGQGLLSPAPGASSRVAATAAGRLLAVYVREGDRVKPGQVLALVENRVAKAQERSAEAAARAAQADAQSAELTVGATRSDARNAVAQAVSALQSAQAERDAGIQSAQSALQGARSDLRKALSVANPGDLRNAVQQARLALRAAQSERSSTRLQAQNALQTAQTDLQRTQAGSRPQEIATAQAAVSQANATRQGAAAEAARAQRLFNRGLFSQRQLEEAQTALRVAESGLQSAQAQLDLLQAGARPEEVATAQLRVDAARQSLEAARQSGDDRVAQAQAQLAAAQLSARQTSGGRTEDVRAARGRLLAAQAALSQAERSGRAKVAGAQSALRAAQASGFTVAAREADAASKRAAQSGSAAAVLAAQAASAQNVIRAPLGGIVTRRSLDPGDVADTSTPILEIADPNALGLVAQLPAEEGAAVRPGMPVRVKSDAASNTVFAGRVSSVGSVDPQSGLLSIRVTVANAGERLRSGALASCDIVVARHPSAVAVPQACVLTREGEAVVFTVENGKAHQHAVKIGATSGGWVEIRSGLRPSTSVVQLGQYELEDDTAVRVASSSTPAATP